ncbi:MAG TPA: polymer-forming cytoskeletal protein, partial [Pseudacidobacterium sp.]|nr:polymer-forming cytoskeletal protein [Pseudacidobacterium sp.]
VVAQRISIEDGAFFKGGIDIRKPGNEKAEVKPNSGATQTETAKAVTV